MMAWRTCVVETPFRAPTPELGLVYLDYAAEAMAACFRARLSPYASHDVIPRLLAAQTKSAVNTADDDAALRKAGIEAGYAWQRCADVVVFGVDHGWSEGMRDALKRLRSRVILNADDDPADPDEPVPLQAIFLYEGGKLIETSWPTAAKLAWGELEGARLSGELARLFGRFPSKQTVRGGA
jgi:hypothetical protein